MSRHTLTLSRHNRAKAHEGVTPCSVEGCEKPVRARGWCSTHHQRWRVHGSPDVTLRAVGLLDWLNAHTSHRGDGCLIFPFKRRPDGYGQVIIDGKNCRAHRVMCEAVHGPPPTAKHEAAHGCGNGHLGCVSPEHLRWATRSENIADRIVHGTGQFGERNPSAKLTEQAVFAIRGLAGKLPRSEAAKLFGVSTATISDIQRRRRWAWLGGSN